MNPFRLFIVLAVALFTLSGCAKKGSESTDTNGNCNQSFVSDYNAIGYEAENMKQKSDWKRPVSEIIEQARVVKAVCDRFYAKHSNVSCKAGVRYGETQVHSSDRRQICDLVTNALNQ